jgi:hypothetical protein
MIWTGNQTMIRFIGGGDALYVDEKPADILTSEIDYKPGQL